MVNDDPNFNWEEIQTVFDDRMRWATLSVSIREIADDNKALVRDLSQYDAIITIQLLAGLLTLPKYQSQCIRLEILVALAVVFCKGRNKPKIENVARWFFQIGRTQCVLGEDLAEDFFSSLVTDRNGNYRLIEGAWESAGFYTQRISEIVSTMPDDGKFVQIKRSFRALLIISDMICEKAGLCRYVLGSEEHHSALTLRDLPGRNALISRVTLTFEELSEKGITKSDILPFLFNKQMRDRLLEQEIGCSDLDRYPLILNSENQLIVALPSALSVAVRDFVIKQIIEGGLVEVFNSLLAKKYSKLFFDTPLLGGPMRAPVGWKMFSSHRLSTFSYEIDRGYFISFHLFMASVETHVEGGFKFIYQDEGELTDALQESINNSIEQISKHPSFKNGLIILVGCGWGKGYATKDIEVDHPKWRLESMSAADLIRLSWIDDMSPSYIWRIQDGLDAVVKNGVEIVNPNGILNLIGWIRCNEGHLIPHSQFLDVEISTEKTLVMSIPLNLLRQVRADSDLGYDRHRAIDNIGLWHDIQHKSSNPLFSSESFRRIYVSMDHIQKRILTSVYEGKLKLWVTVTAPNITDKDIEFRLWEMANEWLHRIGSKLDRFTENLTQTINLKVYVEFQDTDLTNKNPEPKPKAQDLIKLYYIDEIDERNAIKAVFKPKFLSGFRVAENIAERLFVFNVTRAFLQLLKTTDIEGEAEKITINVVQNQEARSFHVFHAHHYIDYVRDTLTEKLVGIDEIDDAAAKIGLAWRVHDRNLGNTIQGSEACTSFLNKVVKILSDEIVQTLSTFNRVSTLIRLIRNCEKASSEEDLLKRTSAAIIGLHGQTDSTIETYVKHISRFVGANIASRVLIEMAVCECPIKDGVQISDIELSKLVASLLNVNYHGRFASIMMAG